MRKTLLLFIALIWLTGCAPVSNINQQVNTPTVPPLPQNPQTLLVFAAGSLTESFTELGQSFEKQLGTKVELNFANSNTLAEQILQGAPADVFAPAALDFMEKLVEKDRVNAQSVKLFARNQLVVILPKSNPADLHTLQDLAKPGIKLVMGAKKGPQGKYVEAFLSNASASADFGADYKDAVYANVVSYESTAKSVVSKVVLGEADAGIAYITDAASAADKVLTIPIPEALNVIAEYPIAPLKEASNPQLAQQFVDFVLSPEGQQILAKYGFLPPQGEQSDAASAEIQITDALGRQITLPKPPQRIVIAGKALFMLLDAAYVFPQASERIIGYGSASQGSSNFIRLIDPKYDQKAVLESDAGAEQVAALQPDLVLMKSYLAEKLGKPIETLGIPVVYIDFETPEQYMRDLMVLGAVFQDEARAREVNAFYQKRLSQVAERVKDVPSKPRVLMLYYDDREGTAAFSVPPASWMQTRLIEMAGGEPLWLSANPGQGWAKVSLEQIAAWDAEAIFIISYFKNPSEVVAGLEKDSQWQALRAVREEKLFAFAGDIYSWDQPDVRWILGLSWMAQKLHPDRFKDWDMVQQASEFYQQLYRLDQTFFEENIRPKFQGDLP